MPQLGSLDQRVALPRRRRVPRTPGRAVRPARGAPQPPAAQGPSDPGLRPDLRPRRGPWLYDDVGDRYLDLLCGFGVFALGRGHPAIKAALHEAIDLDLPSMVQMDSALFPGLLADALCARSARRSSGSTSATRAPRPSSPRSSSRARSPGGPGSSTAATPTTASRSAPSRSTGAPRSARASAPCSPTSPRSPSATSARCARARTGRRGGLLAEPIQGKGVYEAPGAYWRARSRRAATARSSSWTRSRPASAAPAPSGATSSSASPRTSSARRRRCRAGTSRWPRSSRATTSSAPCTPRWSAPSCTRRPSSRTSWRWLRGSPPSRPRRRAARRARRRDGRPLEGEVRTARRALRAGRRGAWQRPDDRHRVHRAHHPSAAAVVAGDRARPSRVLRTDRRAPALPPAPDPHPGGRGQREHHQAAADAHRRRGGDRPHGGRLRRRAGRRAPRRRPPARRDRPDGAWVAAPRTPRHPSPSACPPRDRGRRGRPRRGDRRGRVHRFGGRARARRARRGGGRDRRARHRDWPGPSCTASRAWWRPTSRRRAALDGVFDGARFCFHVAARYAFWPKDPEPYYATNVVGSRNVVGAAWRAGVERVCYTSTVATIGLQRTGGGAAANEDDFAHVEHLFGNYKRSKYVAEHEVLRLAAQGAPVVLVQPTFPVGPGDRVRRRRASCCSTSSTGGPRVRRHHLQRRARRRPRRRARACARAWPPGHELRPRRRELSRCAMLGLLAELSGLERPPSACRRGCHSSPRWRATRSRAASCTASPTSPRRHPDVGDPDAVRRRARPRRLHYRSRPTREALADAVAYFVDTGRVDPGPCGHHS